MDLEPPRELVYDDVDEEHLKFYKAHSSLSQFPGVTVSGLWNTLLIYIKDLDPAWNDLFLPSQNGVCTGDKHMALKEALEACIKDKDKDISDICRLG